ETFSECCVKHPQNASVLLRPFRCRVNREVINPNRLHIGNESVFDRNPSCKLLVWIEPIENRKLDLLLCVESSLVMRERSSNELKPLAARLHPIFGRPRIPHIEKPER